MESGIMDFDVMRIIFMVLSIVIGNFAGAYIEGFLGMGGATFGAIIVGIVIYYIYSMLSGQKTFFVGAIVFGILNFVSIWITGYVGSITGFVGGIFAIVAQALVLSLVWGWVGGQVQPPKTVKTGLSP